jgi:alkylhydroperoxidase family enzyme
MSDRVAAGISGLRLRSSADTEGGVSRVLGKLEETGQSLTVSRLVANSRATFLGFVYLSDGLLTRSVLPRDLRELCILRLGTIKNAPYEFAEHVAISARAGVTDDDRVAIVAGELDRFGDDVRAAIVLVERLATGDDWTADDWRDARSRFGDDGAVELVLLAGMYGGLVPMLTRALGLDPEDARHPTTEAAR